MDLKGTKKRGSAQPGSARGKMPKWERSPDDLVDLFRRTVAAFPQAEGRKMFGYPCVFVNGNMAAGLFGRSLFVRLGPEDLARLLKIKGAAPFAPMPGRIMREYAVVPPDFLRPGGPLREWVEKALGFASSLPAKRKAR